MLCSCSMFSAIKKLANSSPKRNVKDARESLTDAWNATKIEFVDTRGDDIHGRTLLEKMLSHPFKLRVHFEADYSPDDPSPGVVENTEEGSESNPVASESALCETGRAVRTLSLRADPVVERVIRALDIQEQGRDFIWAGFVVKDLLPGLGIDEYESQILFDRMRNEGVIALTKKPSPKNPEFSATCVQLCREHPAVRRVLGSNGHPKGFQPVRIRGESLSETIKRERR